MPSLNTRHVGFILPVIDGEIWLGQRGTPPYQGMYGPVGGKSEPRIAQGFFETERYITKPGGCQVLSIADRLSLDEGRELLSETAAREFCEEIYSHLKYPDDFSRSDITDICKLGFVSDVLEFDPGVRNVCDFFLAKVHRKDFNPSARELTDFRPLAGLRGEQLLPFAKMCFIHLRWLEEAGNNLLLGEDNNYRGMQFSSQMPDFEMGAEEFRLTSLFGVYMYFHEKGYL